MLVRCIVEPLDYKSMWLTSWKSTCHAWALYETWCVSMYTMLVVCACACAWKERNHGGAPHVNDIFGAIRVETLRVAAVRGSRATIHRYRGRLGQSGIFMIVWKAYWLILVFGCKSVDTIKCECCELLLLVWNESLVWRFIDCMYSVCIYMCV